MCDQCDKTFIDFFQLRSHKRVHNNEKSFSCDQCDKIFAREPSLKSHKESHQQIKLNSCNQCVKTFAQKSDLVSHARVHTDTKIPKAIKFQSNRMFVKFVRNISARLINWKLTKGSILEWSHINVPNVTNVSARQELLCVINFLMQERMVNLHAMFVSRPSLKL